MENKSDKGKYWPYMILGFIMIGVTLGYWTVKHAIGMPVQESNEYMMKYQTADTDANKIIEAQQRFDQRYNLQLVGMKTSDFKPKFLKRKPGRIVELQETNRIDYLITDKAGKPVSDANVTLLVTRPQTQKEDQIFKEIPGRDGHYVVEKLTLKKPGRYILRVRAQKGDAIGYQDTPGYWNPPKDN
ncbi:FixH family protein [Nitratifractor sp.]